MNYLEIYEGILYETDKVQAPVFYIEHYNYVINKAILRVVRKAYKLSDDEAKPEIFQEDVDGIRVLEKEYAATETAGQGELRLSAAAFTLPDDYFHLRSCVATFKPVAGKNCYNATTRIDRRCRRFTGNLDNVSADDYYAKPSMRLVYGQMIQDQVKIHFGKTGKWALEKVTGIYVKYPQIVKLEELNGDIVAASNKESEFPKDICDRIIDEAVSILLEIWNNPRLTNQLSIKNNS